MGRAALIMVLGFSTAFGTIKHNVSRQAESASEVSALDYERIVARNAANCGAGLARHKLIEDNSWRPVQAQEAQTSSEFAPIVRMMDSRGAYAVRFDDETTDSLLSAGQARLTFGTRFGDARHECKVLMKRRYVMPPVPSAVYLGAPSTFNFSGAAFAINGNDTKIGGPAGSGTGAAVPGIGVLDSASQDSALAALDPNQANRIRGVGGTPSVDVATDTVDFSEAIDRLEDNPDRIFPADTTIGGSFTWGSVENPEITLCEGNLTLTGGGVGAGVLVIKGSLTMQGSFDWVGPIIVTGDSVTVTVEAHGNPNIYGALMVEADYINFDMRGHIGMYYSTEALQGNVGKLNLCDFDVVSWWE